VLSLACPLLLSNRYQIKKHIGHGRLGRVYYGTDKANNHEVSIRILPAALFSNQQAIDNFTAQLDALSQIRDTHIVQVLGWGSLDSSNLFVITDFVQGQSLRDELNKHHPIDLAKAIEIMSQACHGVASAHRARVLHRDLKPDNIFLDLSNGKVHARVADFAIAAIHPSRGGSVVTDTG